jgi:ABC-type multidrug transport system fused ATPase/permease subunit
MSQFLSKLLYVTKGHHKSLLLMIFLFLFVSGLEVFGTGAIGPFIAIATSPDSIENISLLSSIYKQGNFQSEQQFLMFLGAIIIVAFYLKGFFSFKAQKMIFEFAYGLKAKLAYKLMKAYMAAPYSYHLSMNSATIIQNISRSTDDACLGAIVNCLICISNSVVVLALVLLLINTDTMALILIAILLLVILCLLYPLKDRLARWGKEGWHASGEMIRVLNHGLGGLKETRVIGCESYFEAQMEEQTKRYAKNLSLAAGYGNLPRFAIEAFIISFLIVFTILFINFNQGNGELFASVLGIFALASIRLLPAVSNLISSFNIVRTNIHGLERLYFDFKELEKEKLVSRSNVINDSATLLPGKNKQVMSFTKDITIDNITFKYPNAARNVLKEISLTIQKGQSIGIIGKSGSGKTTLVDVLLGLFMPQKGDIKVDGVSVYDSLRAWQDMLGYVPQSIFLIDDTLERNIAFGVPDELIDRDRLMRALEIAQLSEVVEQLPNGVETVVGERGILLSGGQRQRVGIARVLYHEREILIFDEATAALDTETEHLVTEATKALSGTKTIIIIAHRLSTIEHCDCIFQIENGQILKSGSYQEVVLSQ